MKRAYIEAQFPDIKGCPTLTAIAMGSRSATAITAAVRVLMESSKIKGKKWTGIMATITVTPVLKD
jgi:hypothetical protein